MPNSPGTVSKILWHFTGGPKWNIAENRQGIVLKSQEDAYDVLCKILASGELRIGKYKEVVHVEDIWYKQISPGSVLIDPTKKVPAVIESSPVTCIADIPIMHLSYHAERYGKMSIGFHRESVIRHGFSPVFYQFVGSDLLEKFHAAFNGVAYLHRSRLSENEAFPGGKRPVTGQYRDSTGIWRPNEDEHLRSIEALKSNISDLLAFVKSFNLNEIDSIYCEREWRSTKAFKFGYHDVSMIVVPRNGNYFSRFIEDAHSIGLPRTVSVVAWEDLVEH